MMQRLTLALAALAVLAVPATAQFDPGTPALTEEMVDTVARAQEVIMSVKFRPEHRQRLAKIMQSEWNRPGSTVARDTLQLVEAMPRLMALPERTRRLAIESNLLQFIIRAEADARSGDASSQLILDVYRATHAPILPQVPLFTAPIADAYLDAFLFAGEVKSGKPAPRLSAAQRTDLRRKLAGDFAKMTPAQRNQMTETMAKIAVIRIGWSEMPMHERLIAKADLGGRLSMEEQQFVQQARQMVRSHNLQMMTSTLNNMAANQQLIMGSAPRFNPASQRWERIGGINTEFH